MCKITWQVVKVGKKYCLHGVGHNARRDLLDGTNSVKYFSNGESAKKRMIKLNRRGTT